MNWVIIPRVLSFGVAILLCVRGAMILARSKSSPHIRSFGVLTIFLAVLYIIGQTLLLFSHLLVFSPEFKMIMVQGPLARLGLGIIILGLAVVFGFGWHLARSVVGWVSSRPQFLSAGLIVGLLSVIRLQPLNPDNLEPLLIIYCYDLWWPPLLIWLSVCLIEIYSTLLQFNNRLVRVWTATFMIIGLGVLALRQPTLSVSSSQGCWVVCLLIVIPTNMILTAWIASRWLKAKFSSFGRWTRLDSALVSICVGSLGSPLFIGGTLSSEDQTISTLLKSGASWFWLGWLILVLGLAGGHQLYRIRRGGRLEWPKMSKPLVRWSIFLLALTFIVSSLIGLFCFASLDLSIALTIFFLSWILLSEVVSSGMLSRFWQSWRQGKLLAAESPLRRNWKAAWEKTREIGNQLSGWLKGLTSIPSTPVAVVKVLVGIALLIALVEIPNAGKTIIQPFIAFGFSDQDTYSQLLAEQLFNNLGLFKQQLQPAIIIPSPGAAQGKTAEIETEVLSTALDSVDAMLDSSNDLEIGGVRIPLEVFVIPIQKPVRMLLGVNVVNGSVQLDQNNYIAYAYSNQGAIWVAEFSAGSAMSSDEYSSQTVETTYIDAVTRLAEELAFKIICHDPTLAAMGMTDSWEAFRSFQAGWQAMQRFENDDYDALTEAIEKFREAIKKDNKFALAYYHLGLASQHDGQPAAATEAFRSSLIANPEFVTGYNTLAYHLYYFDDYYLGAPAAIRTMPVSDETSRQSRASEARDLWWHIILINEAVSVPVRASAYYGLCLDALDSDMSLQAYFYCRQAARLYGELPISLRSDPRIKQAEASVLNTTGVVLNKALEDVSYSFPPDVWSCYESGIYSAYASAALQYYKRALALQPNDPILRCNAASSAYALGQHQPMQELEMDSEAHLRLARYYHDLAKSTQDPYYFYLALDEYQKAIERNPDNIWALNGYAYTFWVWRYYMPETEPPEGPDFIIADLAEDYAHKAVDLVADKQSSLNEGVVRSTLAEVLLGKARPQDAIQILQYVVEENLIPDHPITNEIRWDLAQAYLCVGGVEQANHYLDQIRENESGREFRPFTDTPNSLSSDLVLPTCPRDTKFSTEPTW